MGCFGCCGGGEDFRRVSETGPKPVHNTGGSLVYPISVFLFWWLS